MAMHFNGLLPAQAERLALLLEELGEAQQAIGKILRHGLDSHHPATGSINRSALEKELGDVRFAIDLLCAAGDVNRLNIMAAIEKKSGKVGQYLHHQTAKLLEHVDQGYRR